MNKSFINSASFQKTLERLKNGTHRHFCSRCQIAWEHEGARVTDRHKAHCCPNCGEFITELFMSACEIIVRDWHGQHESPRARLYQLRGRDEFEQQKTRRIERRVYWLLKKGEKLA